MSINIKPSHEGLFTAKANRAGESVQAYARSVTGANSQASSATKKQAVFAENANKWNHKHSAYGRAAGN